MSTCIFINRCIIIYYNVVDIYKYNFIDLTVVRTCLFARTKSCYTLLYLITKGSLKWQMP